MMLELLKKSLEDCPIVPMGDYNYFVHPLTDGIPLVEPELLDEVADKVIEIADMDCDYILTAQSMGFPLATALSLKTGIPFKFIRKRRYGLPDEASISQITGYSSSDLHINFVNKGDRVFFVDDVLSTGGTLRAILTALDNIGAEISDIVFVFEKVGAKEDLEKEFGIPIKSLLRLDMDSTEIKIIGEGF